MLCAYLKISRNLIHKVSTLEILFFDLSETKVSRLNIKYNINFLILTELFSRILEACFLTLDMQTPVSL